MKSKVLILSILITFSEFLFSCKKGEKEDSLPSYTETGANTFSFKVNRKVYQSYVGYLPAFTKISVCYNYIDTFRNNNFLFSIIGNIVYLQDNKHIQINIHYMPKVGTYILSNYIWLGKGDYANYEDDNPGSILYETDSIHTGRLIITKLDTINRIISGKFNFDAKQSCVYRECNSIISVEGQFDVKYKPNVSVNYY